MQGRDVFRCEFIGLFGSCRCFLRGLHGVIKARQWLTVQLISVVTGGQI
jgi:hypothetical protein